VGRGRPSSAARRATTLAAGARLTESLLALGGRHFLNPCPEVDDFLIGGADGGAERQQVVGGPKTPVLKQVAGPASVALVEARLQLQHLAHREPVTPGQRDPLRLDGSHFGRRRDQRVTQRAFLFGGDAFRCGRASCWSQRAAALHSACVTHHQEEENE